MRHVMKLEDVSFLLEFTVQGWIHEEKKGEKHLGDHCAKPVRID